MPQPGERDARGRIWVPTPNFFDDTIGSWVTPVTYNGKEWKDLTPDEQRAALERNLRREQEHTLAINAVILAVGLSICVYNHLTVWAYIIVLVVWLLYWGGRRKRGF